MTSAAAQRMRAHRRREAAGHAIVPVKIKLVPVGEFLIESELLEVSKAEDRKAIGLAVGNLLELLMAARRL